MKKILIYVVLNIVAWNFYSCKRKTEALFKTPLSIYETYVPVLFQNFSENAVSFQWNFGDGETSNERSPVHTYSHAGRYSVSLIAYGKKEKKYSVYSARLVVKEPEYGFTGTFDQKPTSLTYDAVNEKDAITNYNFNYYEMRVYQFVVSKSPLYSIIVHLHTKSGFNKQTYAIVDFTEEGFNLTYETPAQNYSYMTTQANQPQSSSFVINETFDYTDEKGINFVRFKASVNCVTAVGSQDIIYHPLTGEFYGVFMMP
jgi:PKD repeat protein